MPNSSSTPVIDSAGTTNSPVPLCYGWVWATGLRHAYYMMQNTGNKYIDFTRVGFWLLGEGEWDGNNELWINDELVWTSEWDDPGQFHFHRGCDTPIGSGLFPSSSGPDQKVDTFWSSLPTAIDVLTHHRIAYYAIKRKQPIAHPTNTHQDDPSQFTDVAPVGLWRSMRCRIFDDLGKMVGYAFTTNIAQQIVDAILRRRIYPEYGIDYVNGIDDISDAARARFSWESIYEAREYFDEFIADGTRRFTGNFCFKDPSNLDAVLETMLRSCRSFLKEQAGKIYLICDKPRPSIFTLTRAHVMPGSFKPSDKIAEAAPNAVVGKMRDILIPVAAAIAGITCADHKNPVVTTEQPHPFNAGDRLQFGATNTIYDGEQTVATVPDGESVSTMTLVSKGTNYPAAVGAGGVIGLRYSRFKERAPRFRHQQNQLASGFVGLGLARRLKEVPVEYDFAVSTFDQVSRICRYERDRALGQDGTPYVTPKAFSVRIPLHALDGAGSGVAAIQLEPGDRITVDSSANWFYAGDYEVLDKTETYHDPRQDSGGSGGAAADESTGVCDLDLGPYDETCMYDSTDPDSAGWSNVPGSEPGDDGQYTGIDLVDGGHLAFITGAVASGSTFDLPSTGFNPANMVAWASPQGYIEAHNVMHVIAKCDVDGNRRVTLNYEDGDGHLWHGDVNFAALTWMGDSSEVTKVTVGGITYIVATLAGGETICFGCGILGDGIGIPLPAGFTLDKTVAVAFPVYGDPGAAGDNQAHGVGSYVDGSGAAHVDYQDGDGHVWHGSPKVLVFGWLNNAGSVTTETDGASSWVKIPVSTGYVLGVGKATLAHAAQMTFPAEAAGRDSLQSIATPHTFDIVDHPAHGVGACYMDPNGFMVLSFEDGEGHVWHGTGDIFALFYEPGGSSSGPRGGVVVSVTPYGVVLAQSGTQQFQSIVTGATDATVTWSVDGVDGGNVDVGTIDATGLYTAPAADGTHTIRATSNANSAAWAQQSVRVGTGSGTSGGSGGTSVSVTPFFVRLSFGGTYQFTGTVSGAADPTLEWLVNGVVGGDGTAGTIDSTGLYTAPATTTSATITAKLVSAPSVAGSANVFVGTAGGTSGPSGFSGTLSTS